MGAIGGYTPGSKWQQLPIGGGGFCTGLSMSNDGQTVIARTDTSGAFTWSEAKTKWTSITNANVLPAGYGYGLNTGGAYEAVVAPGNSQIIYQMVDGFLFKSADGGNSFVALTTFNSGVQLGENTVYANGGGSRLFGPKMAVDPANPNILLVGTGVNGVSITKDGGTSWASVPVPPTSPQDYYIIPLNTSVTASSQLTFNLLAFPSVTAGGLVFDLTTPASIPLGTTVSSKSGATATISTPVTVAAGDLILFLDASVKAAATSAPTSASPVLTFASVPTISAGFAVIDLTNTAAIPAGTTIISSTSTTVTLSNSVTVASGDVIGIYNANNGIIDYSGYCIAFDPSSAVVGSGLTAATQGVYIAPWNSPVQQSTNGGTTWAALTTGAHPYTCQNLSFDPSGNMWLTAQQNEWKLTVNSNVWKFTAAGGTFTNFTASQTGAVNPLHTVSPDPNNPGHVALISNSGVALSFTVDSFAHTVGTFLSATIVNDATWLNVAQVPASGAAMFHPTRTGELWCAQGVGVMRTVPPSTNTPITWNGIVNGIENLTTSQILAPPGGTVHVTVWDRGIFRIDDVTKLATSTNWVTNQPSIILGSGMDYSASDPTFLVACAAFGLSLHSAFSTNSGKTWTEFPSQQTGYSGCIAATSPNAIIWIPAIPGPGLPLISTNQGTSWTGISGVSTGLPTTGNGYYGGFAAKVACVCADKNASNTFYICYQNASDPGNGIWKSTDAGVTWTHTFSGNVTTTRSNCRLASVPGEPAGTLLYCGAANQAANGVLKISTDGNGATWTNVNALLTNVTDYGFGLAAPGASHVTLYVIGTYNGVPGIYASSDLGATLVQINDLHPAGVLLSLATISGDWNTYGRVYVSANGNSFYYRNYVSGL